MRETGQTPNPTEMSGLDASGNFMPENSPETPPEIKGKNATLQVIGRYARLLALAAAASESEYVHPGNEALIQLEGHYTEQFRKLDDLETKEEKLKRLFGTQFTSSTQWHREQVEKRRMAFRMATNHKEMPFLEADIDAPWNNLESEPNSGLKVSGLETRDGKLDAKTVRRIILETYPKSWNQEIESVVYKNSADVKSPYTDSKGSSLSVLAWCEGGGGSKKSKIVFFNGIKTTGIEYVNHTLLHESAHAAMDWVRSATMSSVERADMALAVAERLRSKDRYKSSYVEKISNPDKQTELYTKAVEYVAEISSQYARDATKLHIKDFQLVDSQIHKTDPQFNWKDAKQRRDQLIAQALKTHK